MSSLPFPFEQRGSALAPPPCMHATTQPARPGPNRPDPKLTDADPAGRYESAEMYWRLYECGVPVKHLVYNKV